jgi:uncharacterized membrane protein
VTKARAAAPCESRTIETVERIVVAYPGDDSLAIAETRHLLAGYGTVPIYRSMFRRAGFAADLENVERALADGGRSAAADAVSDALLDEFVVTGDLESQRQRIEAYRRTGLDVPVLACYPGRRPVEERDELVQEALRRFAPQPQGSTT